MSLSRIDQSSFSANPAAGQSSRADQAANKSGFFSNGNNPSFSDLVDTVNPLQHIPVVSSVYQKASGDTISPAAKIAGGLLIGGIFGAVAALADCILEQATGKGAAETVLSGLGKDTQQNENSEPSTEVAQLDAAVQEANTVDVHATEPVEDIVDVAAFADDKPLNSSTSLAQTMAAVVPPNPFLGLAQAAAAQAQTQSQEIAAPNATEVASIARTLWQRMEKVYGQSQALEALYQQLGQETTIA